MEAWENLQRAAGVSPPKSSWERLKEAAQPPVADRQEQSAIAAERAHEASVPAADRQEQSAIKAQQAHEATQAAAAACSQQEGRCRPVAISTPRQTTVQIAVAPATKQQEGRYRPVAIPMPQQVETKPATPVSTPKAAQRSGNYNLQGLPDLGRGPSRVAAIEKPIKSGWADERVWDRQISTAIGTLEKPKISTLPFTGEPPALMLLSATAATNQQEGRSRPTAVSTTKQTKEQSSLATERADEADKMMVSSESRQRQQALATERADEADKMLVPSASRQAAQSTTTSSAKSQEGRRRPAAIDMPKQVVTQEEWAAQQWNALTQKINDTQTKLDAANARYASVARYGTVEDRISLRTEIRDLEQQIKDLKKERGDPNLLERIEKTLSGSAKLYGAQFLGVDEWLSNVEQSYQEWKEDAGIPSGGYKDGPGGRVWGEEPTAESAKKQAEYVQNLGSNLKESGAANVERAKEGLDGVGRTLVDVGVAGSQMLGDVGLGIVTGGGSMLPMLVRSFGGGVQEAREKGYSVAQQTGLGLASAATEYFTERLFDGNPAYDKDGLINKLVERVAGDGKLVSALSSVPAEIISEGLEEVIADILEPISEKVLTGNWTGYDIEQIIHDGIVGMALGGLGQGGQYIADKTRGAVDVALGSADAKSKPRMSMEDFVNTESPVWNNVEYKDIDTQQRLMQEKHQEMVAAGEVVTVPESAMDEVAQSYPDLRHMKKSERNPILKQKIRELKDNLREMLNGLKGAYEFEVNGYILEARLYDTGIKEVLEKITQEKAEMLTQSGEIFRKAQYLYSTPDYKKNTDIYRWNYFYTPVQIGDQIVGVRIAVRDVIEGQNHLPESQIYNWNIKENASLGGGQPGQTTSSLNASSDASSAGALGGGGRGGMPDRSGASSATTGDKIPQPPNGVKPGESAPASYADTLREMQQPGARQPVSYTDELAHVNELLQNAALPPRDQAYIQEDIADAQRSCDAAMKAIVNPNTTSEERAQAVRRAIDALDYARQRINDLGLPATQLGVSTAQDVLADISERLKPYWDELGGFREP